MLAMSRGEIIETFRVTFESASQVGEESALAGNFLESDSRDDIPANRIVFICYLMNR